MSRDVDISLGLVQRDGCRRAGKHHGGVGVFVIDRQQAMVRVLTAQRQRQEADKVVVETELPGLTLGGLVLRIKVTHAVKQGIAPTNQHLWRVAGRYRQGFVQPLW